MDILMIVLLSLESLENIFSNSPMRWI